MNNTEHLRYFVQIVRAGGISRAAEQLGLPKSSISRGLKALETALGANLIIRNTRSMHLTPEGDALFSEINSAFEQIDRGVETLKGSAEGLSGVIRVSLPMAFGREVVMPALAHFPHPELRLDLRFAPQGSNPVREGIDLSIEVGPLTDSELVAQPLVNVEQWLVCHPSRSSSDGAHIDWVDRRHALSGLSFLNDGILSPIDLSQANVVNDPLSIRDLISRTPNEATGLLPDLYARAWVNRGLLRRLAPEYPVRPQSPLYFVGTRVGLGLPRVKAFIAFVESAVKKYRGQE